MTVEILPTEVEEEGGSSPDKLRFPDVLLCFMFHCLIYVSFSEVHLIKLAVH